MRLVLEAVRRQPGLELSAKESHRVELIGLQPQAHPHQVEVVRHQAVGGAEQALSGGRMQQKFPKGGVEALIQPSLSAV